MRSVSKILQDTLSDVDKAKLAMELLTGIPWCRKQCTELYRAIELHLSFSNKEAK